MYILSSVPDERASCFCLLASDVRELTHSQWGLSLFSEALAAKQAGSLKKPGDCSSYGPVTSHCGPCPEPWRWVLLSTGLELSSIYLLLPCLQFFTWSPCTSRPWGSGWPEPRKVSAGPVPLLNCVRVVTSLLTLLYTGKNAWKLSFAAILCFCVCLFICSLPVLQQKLFRFYLRFTLFKRLC